MKKILVVIDMQNDFIDGSLGTKEAQSIVQNVKEKIAKYAEPNCTVFATRDTHTENYMQTTASKVLTDGKSTAQLQPNWKKQTPPL